MAYLTGLSALGVDQAVFTGMDGLVIEALGQGPPSAEALAAELAALARRMDPLAQALGGKVLRFTLATEDLPAQGLGQGVHAPRQGGELRR